MNIPTELLPIITFVAFVIILTIVTNKFYQFKNRNKKTPLNIDILRSPGQSLQRKINEINEEISENINYIFIVPCALFCQISISLLTTGNVPTKFIISLSIIITIISCIYFSLKNISLFSKRNKITLAYECELSVGQELQNLMSEGFKIYHDFPANSFNIDHIAVGPSGIYAIETKGRAKPTKAENNNWHVTFDGKQLIFPYWKESKPIEQAKRQAIWLQKWIKESTQEEVRVTPVLAIAGWFVKGTSQNMILYNGKNSKFIGKRTKILTEKQIEKIAYQIEQKCRDIKSQAYRKNKK